MAAPEAVERRPQRGHDQVRAVARDLLGPFPLDLDVQAAIGHPDDDVVVEGQRQPGAVEARAQVGAGRGHADVHRRGTEGRHQLSTAVSDGAGAERRRVTAHQHPA